jgi:hypothetical protein
MSIRSIPTPKKDLVLSPFDPGRPIYPFSYKSVLSVVGRVNMGNPLGPNPPDPRAPESFLGEGECPRDFQSPDQSEACGAQDLPSPPALPVPQRLRQRTPEETTNKRSPRVHSPRTVSRALARPTFFSDDHGVCVWLHGR